jgi:uncharacterized protein (TIGR02271 family)
MATMNKNVPVVTGMFPDRASAEQAYRDLSTRGYGQKDVNLVMSDETRKRHFSGDDTARTELGTKAAEGAGIGAGVGGTLGAIAAAVAAVGTSIVLPGLGLVVAGPLAAALAGAGAGGAAGGLLGALVGWGIPEETVKRYEAGIKKGGILMGFKPRSTDDAQYFESRWNANTAGTPGGTIARTQESGTIPVVEEQLEVGKREVELGKVQVSAHVVEKPVSETVTLREEHAAIERRPVNRPASEADLAAMKGETIEIRETAEKAVVSKSARVVEEVVVGKEATSSTQQVSDTVRKTVVEVERDSDSSLLGGDAYEDAFRKDYTSRYATSGGSYDDYAPAYRYGTTLASDSRYSGRSWNDIEADARTDWESRYPGSTWDNMKAAVRHGWEKVTGQRG